jgi:hypothetical protein
LDYFLEKPIGEKRGKKGHPYEGIVGKAKPIQS